jgi:type IV pilus assembly protein PilM
MIISFSKRSYLGIDIGSASIKIVELRDVNRAPELVTYGLAEFPLDRAPGDTEKNIADTAATIVAACAKAKTKSKQAFAALPTYAVFTSIISLPKLSKGELKSAIQWEAKKVMPLPVEEMILDPQVLDEPGPNETMRVLLTGAPKTMVDRYIRIFQKTNLVLLGLETEGFALVRALVGRDKSSTMIIDMGASTTDILIIDNNIPFLNRSIDVGGLHVTRAIGRSLNIALPRAEQFKYDIGMNAVESPPSEIPKTIEEAIAPILNEIKYTLTLFQGQSKKSVEKIILSGGSSLLVNFANYLSQTLGMRVYVGDPWARVRYPLELKGVLQESAARFAIAVGLAMRDIK